MSKEILATPYIESAEPLMSEAIDEHVSNVPVAYYGVIPNKATAEGRENHPAIEVEDDSGKSEYSVVVSGDLLSGKQVIVKTPSWSEHPGRGFEALRQNLVADPDNNLVVVGVSFPGAGLNSKSMTAKQAESLKKDGGDFSYIGEQQWKAVLEALTLELQSKGLDEENIKKKLADYEFLLAGSSQGSSNSVGMLQSAPEGITIAGVGLIQNTGWEYTNPIKFAFNFIRHGSEHFKEYTAVNPYNDYPALGPGHNTVLNALRNPNSHFGAVVKAMSRGGDVERILQAVREQERQDLFLLIAGAEKDELSKPEANQKASSLLRASRLLVAQTVIWPGHYHPVMENLSNARRAFREIAR